MMIAILLLACSKDEAPKKTAPSATSPLGTALANPQGMAAQGKGAVVSQQCAIACGARPGIDSSACTKTCIGACATEADIPAIDACASRTAAQSPEL